MHFFCFFEILLIISRADSDVAFIRMYLDDVFIHFAILLSSDIELLIDFYVFEFLSCRFLSDEDDVCEGEQNDVDKFFMVDHEGSEFIQVLAVCFH